MIAEVMIIETDNDYNQYEVIIPMVGEAKAIAREIAAQSGDLHALCIEGKLKNYTLLTTFLTKKGNVIVR